MVTFKLEPNPQFNVSLGALGNVTVVHVSGEIDLATCESVAEVVFDQLGQEPDALVIDLSGVGFMGSTGLSMLVEAHRQAERCGTSLHIVATTPPVLRTLEISGLDSVLPIRGSISAAVPASL